MNNSALLSPPLTSSPIGLGRKTAKINVYVEHRPPLEQYQQLTSVYALKHGDIEFIATATGNHWRKIFNVYAKLLFTLNERHHNTWQALRDNDLLQPHSSESLLFSLPVFPTLEQGSVHIISGKTYAASLGFAEKCTWLNEYFAINEELRLIICPYFDYRQLSNIKIMQLTRLIQQIT